MTQRMPRSSASTRASWLILRSCLKSSPHPHNRSPRPPLDVDRIHEPPDQPFSVARMSSARGPPGTTIADRHLYRSIEHDEIRLQKSVLGAIGMLDHVRTCLATRDEDVVRDLRRGADLSEPAAQSLTEGCEHIWFRRETKKQWLTRKQNRAECQEGDVVRHVAPHHGEKEVVARRFQIFVGGSHQRLQSIESISDRGSAPLDESIGKEEESRAGSKVRRDVEVAVGEADCSQWRTEATLQISSAFRSSDHQRRRMARVCEPHRPRVGIEHEIDERRELGIELPTNQMTESSHHSVRRSLLQGADAQRHPHLPHGRGGPQAMPGDIADREPNPPVGELHHVVPVAADLHIRGCRHVAGRQQDTGNLGEAVGEEASLQGLRDPVLAFGHLALRDILNRPNHSERFSVRPDAKLGLSAQHALGAIGSNDPVLDVGKLLTSTSLKYRLHVRSDASDVVLCYLFHRLLEREGELLWEESVDAEHLVRPRHSVLRDQPLPASDLGCFLSFGQLTLALSQSSIGLVPLDDLAFRSEEHTSELQSRGHLVCRLLLE